MNITSFIHPTRTYLPCTGVGRHINHILLGLAARSDAKVELLCSEQWLGADGKLDARSPLNNFPTTTFPMPENVTERKWKLWGRPPMDAYISDDADWLYCPMETYIPVTKCPVAVTIHDIQAFETTLPWSKTWQHKLFRYKWGRWVRRTLKECKIIFTVSEFSKQRMVDLLGANAAKIVVVGNGIEQSFFDIANTPITSLQSPTDKPYTIVIGGLREKKGADHILALAEVLHARKSNLQIIVAGASEEKYVYLSKAYPNIKLLGMVDDEKLPIIVRRASSLLSLSLYEGFGMPPLEAMAAGIPVVASNVASHPEVIGDAGILVSLNDYDEITDILLALEMNTTLREKYIARGKKHAQNYTWQSCTERVFRALEEYK